MELTKTKRNVALVLVSFAMGMLYFIPYIRFTFYDQTIAVFAITNTEMGILGSVYGTAAIFFYILSGWLANRIEPRKLITISCFATAAITLWLAQLPSFPMLVVIYVLFSFFTIATLWSPYMVIVRNLGNEDEQGRLFGVSDAMRNLFSAIAGYLFVWIFSMFTSDVLGYQGMLYTAVGLYIVFGFLCMKLLPAVGADAKKTEGPAEKKVGIGAALKLPGVWLMGLFLFCCYTTVITQTNYLGTYTTQVLGMDPSLSSILAILRSYILPVLAGIIAGYILDKSKSKLVCLAIFLALLAAVNVFTPMLQSNTIPTVVLTMFISIFAMMILATYWSVMGECGIPLEYTAVASGIVSCIAYLPDVFVTLVVGNWLDIDPASGFSKMFVWMAVWAVLALAVAVVIYLRNKKSAKVSKQ